MKQNYLGIKVFFYLANPKPGISFETNGSFSKNYAC